MKNLANLHWLFVLIDFIGQAIYLLTYFDNILQKKDHQKTVDFQGYSLTFFHWLFVLMDFIGQAIYLLTYFDNILQKKDHQKTVDFQGYSLTFLLALCSYGFYWSSHLFTAIF